MTGQDWMEKDFYAELGVPRDADQAAIKKAYRKLARTYHPDQNKGDEQAESRFKAIGEAYAVLSDPEQRRQYDAIRAMAGGARFSAGPGGAGGGGAGGFEDILGAMFGGGSGGGAGPRVRYSQPGAGGAQGAAGFEDILGSMFGGGGPGGGGAPAGFRAPVRGGDVNASTTLPFRTALEGATVDLTVEGRTITARFPAGVNDGQKIRLRGKGRPGLGGGEPGDLLVTVHVTEHPVFTLDGLDVRLNLPVTFPEATLGATVKVPTPSGETVKMKLPAGTPSGKVLRAKGRGVRTARATGDLLVTVQVVVPQKLSKKAKDALNAFAAASDGTDPRADLASRAAE